MTQIVVTGGSGKAGRAVVRDLVEHGYEVVNVDVVPTSPAGRAVPACGPDRFGETIEALRGADAVVHLAAIPAPRIRTVERTFEINILSTYNVFSAAGLLGLERVVWASSETVLGLPFGRPPCAQPARPGGDARAITRSRTTCRSTRSTRSARIRATRCPRSLGEEMARQFARWSRIPFIGLRFSAIREPAEYASSPTPGPTRIAASGTCGAMSMPATSAQACRLALDRADVSGAEAFIIAAADTAWTARTPSSWPSASRRSRCVPGRVTSTRCCRSTRPAGCWGTRRRHSWRDSSAHAGRRRTEPRRGGS